MISKSNHKPGTALITGASSGIGLAFAELLAAEKYNVILIARDSVALEKLAKRLKSQHNIKAWVFAVDLSLKSAASDVLEFCQQQKIAVDLLINNAGFGDIGSFAKSDLAKQLNMIDLNIRSLTEMTHLFLPQLHKTKQPGGIINVASGVSFLPCPFMNVYAATKHYVLAFSEALNYELKDSKLRVTALCPGPTKTNFAKAANGQNMSAFRGKIPTAGQVALYGWRSYQAGKTVAIHGSRLRLAIFSIRLFPRRFVVRLAARFQRT